MKRKGIKLVLPLIVVLLFARSAFIESADAQSSERGQSSNRKASVAKPPSTRYFALIIGNNQYQYLKKLNTAVNDARELDRVLRETYGFRTRLLLDAGRDQIIDALNEYRANLDEQSYLLIYYAGHGVYDKSIGVAYWLPVDARHNSNARWISADDVTGNIKGMAASHVLVISDSCYSGKLNRGESMAVLPAERQRFLDKMREGHSRTLIASGGNEPVADEGANGHSVFANALLKGLAQMADVEYTAAELFSRFILEQVGGKADQTPEYGVLRNSGHDAGDFVFVKSGAVPANTSSSKPPEKPEPNDNLQKGRPAPDNLIATSEDEPGIEFIEFGKSKKDAIAQGQYKKYKFNGLTNTPVLIAFQKDKSIAFDVEVYDARGRKQKRGSASVVRTEYEISFTPQANGLYIIQLKGLARFGNYVIHLSQF